MFTEHRDRIRADDGFTLVEILVVILIIGILSAIALPGFLGQRTKGQDSATKSDLRNMVAQVESCFVETQDYSRCQGTPYSAGGVSVDSVVASGAQIGYTMVKRSVSGNSFTLVHNTRTGFTRSCTAVVPDGGCSSSGAW